MTQKMRHKVLNTHSASSGAHTRPGVALRSSKTSSGGQTR